MAQCACGNTAHYRLKLLKLENATATIGAQVKVEFLCTNCLRWERSIEQPVPAWAATQPAPARPAPVTGPETVVTVRCAAHGRPIPCPNCAARVRSASAMPLKTAEIRWTTGAASSNDGVDTVPVMVKPLAPVVDPLVKSLLREKPAGTATPSYQATCEHNFPPSAGVPTCSFCGWQP